MASWMAKSSIVLMQKDRDKGNIASNHGSITFSVEVTDGYSCRLDF